ncbi:MAG: hypothetical protein JXR58_12075 [Bacteroidales bacterium]|nr:hypothetical protein [Bacteroidales bacterium]
MVFIFGSCGSGNRLDVDVSDIKVKLEIKRFDQDLKNAFKKGENEVLKLQEAYPDFFELFNTSLISIGHSTDSGYYGRLKEFIDYYLVKEAFAEVEKKFSSNSYINEKLSEAFKHYKYYYPDNNIPTIIAYISGFNLSVATTGDIIAISLEKYLGSDYELYKSMGLNNYSIPNMKKERIAPDCMQAFAYKVFPMEEKKGNLLEHIIYQGKILYFVEAMMPNESESLIMGYSEKQIQWCKENEKNMWNYLLDYKQLFVSDMMTIKKYIGEGPFTINFSKQSPGKAGIWIGWQIVRKYMESNPETSFQELMKNNDYQSILNSSGYNP